MASEDMDDRHFVYENRLASFHGPQPVSKRRGSTATSRAPKALSWPHKSPSATALAKAGFYFNPHPSTPDNVRCFLCHKELDGWEPDDDPLAEHLKHSSGCGWAICAAIEVELGDSAKEDPRQQHLLDARKATFAGHWPYEGKKGWKCKTKQLAEAGWKYTPTLDSDDHTTCTYCQLALDGWEPADKPLDEHRKRSPNCPFFALISQGPAPKKTARGKAARGSKVSRMSIQSIATATSDVQSVSDFPAEHEDSVLTTTSVATQGSRKMTKGKKAATTKGRKTRTKKDEVVEIHEDMDMDAEAEAPPPPPAKPTRGKKRASDEMEGAVAAEADGPAPKKRATRVRASNNAESSILTASSQADVDMLDVAPAKAPVGRKKGRGSTTRTTRKASAASIASTASTASLRNAAQEEAELDRQLELDLDRPLTDDEDIGGGTDTERRKAAKPAVAKGKRVPSRKVAAPSQEAKSDFAMFDPEPRQPDEAEVEAELRTMEVETVTQVPAEEIQVPKKGRKPGPRKASKQTKKAPKEVVEPPPHEVMMPGAFPEPADEESVIRPTEDHDVSVASNATIVKAPAAAAAPAPAPAPVKRGRGRPPKKSAEPQVEQEQASEIRPLPTQQQRVATEAVDAEASVMIQEASNTTKVTPSKPATTKPPHAATPLVEKALPQPPPPSSQPRSLPAPPATPRADHISPAPSAKQAVVSPSPSPQSSDAENQPPSSKPSTSASAKRLVLAPVQAAATATPVRAVASPSKRGNVMGGLQSNFPWSPVDIDLIFAGDDKENGDDVDGYLRREGQLTTPEKNMSVEEWIYHNAGQAEQRLKHECEAMVSTFERAGTRAMRVLEEIVVD